jgi:hypothetical protein
MTRVLVADAIAAAARLYGVPRHEIVGKGQNAYVARVRQAAMYVAHRCTGRSLPDIGHRFGGRDHTTVLFAVQKITRMIDTDPDMRREVARLLLATRAHAAKPDWRRERVEWVTREPHTISAARAPTGGRYPPHWVPPEARG